MREWRVCGERIGNVWCGERVWSVWCVERVGSVWCEMIVGVSGERVFSCESWRCVVRRENRESVVW